MFPTLSEYRNIYYLAWGVQFAWGFLFVQVERLIQSVDMIVPSRVGRVSQLAFAKNLILTIDSH